jgi:hypothetical protein
MGAITNLSDETERRLFLMPPGSGDLVDITAYRRR